MEGISGNEVETLDFGGNEKGAGTKFKVLDTNLKEDATIPCPNLLITSLVTFEGFPQPFE
jgi:hypothetical protein